MDKTELKKRYDKLISGIEKAQMYDGRNKGVDVYVCKKCGERFYTRYKDKGVTPFSLTCRKCKATMTHDDTIPERIANVMGFKVHNWIRPTFEQLQQLSAGMQEHVLDGGLVLEDEHLPKSEAEQEKERIKGVHDQVQKLLDSLQGSDATFLFIGDEGNHFTLSGNPTNIAAQLMFAMIRYPIVKNIIKMCAQRYDELEKELGDEIRNVTMSHLIEINSGNPGTEQ